MDDNKGSKTNAIVLADAAALAGLVERTRKTIEDAVPRNTRLAYEHALRCFAAWCTSARLDVEEITRVPKGLVILVRVSKTDPERHGEEIPIFYSNSPRPAQCGPSTRGSRRPASPTAGSFAGSVPSGNLVPGWHPRLSGTAYAIGHMWPASRGKNMGRILSAAG